MEKITEQRFLLGNIYWAHNINNEFLIAFIFNRDMTKIKDVITGEISQVSGEKFDEIMKNIKVKMQQDNNVDDIDIETSAEMYLNYMRDASQLTEAFRLLPDNKFYKTRSKEDKPTKRTKIACDNILVDKTDLLMFIKQLKKSYRLIEIPIKSMSVQEFKQIVEDSHNF